jgi:regulatory protein
VTGRDERVDDAVDTALRALGTRDRSAAELAVRLEQRGVGEAERAAAVERLQRLGYVDDGRFAESRARQLAERGSGDALIRHDLERRGVAAEVIEQALGTLEPESRRAARIVAARGATPKTARYLASRGFGAEAFEVAVARQD